MINIQNMSEEEILAIIENNSTPGADYDAKWLWNHASGNIVKKFGLKHGLKEGSKSQGSIPWMDIEKGIPNNMKTLLHDHFISKDIFPSFEEFADFMSSDLMYETYKKDYHGNKPEDKNHIKACMARRAIMVLNAEMKEMACDIIVKRIAEKLGIMDKVLTTRKKDYQGKDVYVSDRILGTEILALHVRAGWRAGKFGSDRDKRREFSWTRRDIIVMYCDDDDYDRNKLYIWPSDVTIKQIEEAFADYFNLEMIEEFDFFSRD